MLDTEWQTDLERALTFLAVDRYVVSPAAYLSRLEIPSHRRAFPLARNQALPSAEEPYKKGPMENRLCPYSNGEIEITEHILFNFPLNQEIHTTFVFPILNRYPGH